MNLGDPAMHISVEVADREAARTAEAARLLSVELVAAIGLDVHAAEAEIPEGAKSASAAVIGSLVVGGVLSPMTVRELVRFATAFVQRGSARKVVLEQDGDKLILQAVPVSTQKALADAWIERRLASPSGSEGLGQPSLDREGGEG